jgi:hypothetical protein
MCPARQIRSRLPYRQIRLDPTTRIHAISYTTPGQSPGGSSLALIGSASAAYIAAKAVQPSRGVFDKETRRKPLAFAADAYGISMPLLHMASDGGLVDERIRPRSFGRLAGSVTF